MGAFLRRPWRDSICENIRILKMSITALVAQEIERKSLVNTSDYLNAVPGVTISDALTGFSQIVMRGLATAFAEQSTVSTYFGEVPFTNPLRFGTADMKLVDIERIVVLRGPQGTLYGSGSLGGTVRNIPNAPDLNEFEGKIDLGYSQTAHSDDDNDKIVGVVNLPLLV